MSARGAMLLWVATAGSRRLLRRHLMHFAGREIEAYAPDVVEVGAGDADEACVIGVVDRMDLAVLIGARVSEQKAVFLDRRTRGLVRSGAIIVALPLDHVGVMRGLAVDCPGCPMVMGRRNARLVVDVGENLESKIRIFVEDLQAARHAFAAIGLDEILVG